MGEERTVDDFQQREIHYDAWRGAGMNELFSGTADVRCEKIDIGQHVEDDAPADLTDTEPIWMSTGAELRITG